MACRCTDYIKEYRLEQAAVELVRSSEACDTRSRSAAGYDNASKFSACFKAALRRDAVAAIAPMQSMRQNGACETKTE